jgi:tetratricopeptide (TPR) repeat protein
LTPVGLRKLRDRIAKREIENGGRKYTLERLGEITEIDPATVKKVLNCQGSDESKIRQCFKKFGLTLEDSDYDYVPVQADVSFVGREAAIADLNALVHRRAKVIVIQARGGVGKTTLAWQYLTTERFDRILELWMAKETQNLTSVESVLEEWLQRYFQETAEQGFDRALSQLRQKLRNLSPSKRIGVLIDNLEPALDQDGRFVQAHRRYVELLRVLADPLINAVTLITSRERLREVDLDSPPQHYLLSGLDQNAWQQFFDYHQIQPNSTALGTLHTIYNGNAKAMEILCSAVQADFAGHLIAYWQTQQGELFIERDLEDLVIAQFDRLQQSDRNAYNLLCRLGCYRYQDVATIDIQGLLGLLWDVPLTQQRRIVEALKDRSLVDWEQQSFWLHPVVRGVAIDRLRTSADWEIANRQAADSWTASVDRVETVEDALKAFEAYHHYLQINDFAAAASVILRKRNKRLGRSLYELGLFQQTIPAVTLLIQNLSGYQLSGLYNLLGISYRITGEVHRAIECHKKAKEIADQLEFQEPNDVHESEFFRHDQSSEALINIGLCQIQLGELETALETFTKAEQLVAEDWKPFNFTFLALLSACLNFKQEATRWISKVEVDKLSLFGLTSLGQACASLGWTKRAFEIYRTVEAIAERSHHTPTLGKTMNNLAMLYCQEKDFNTALLKHRSAIEILKRLGAKYDLAESYYQLGLTHQVMGETEQSKDNFHKAIQLFSDMAAPKQVERVRKSLSG